MAIELRDRHSTYLASVSANVQICLPSVLANIVSSYSTLSERAYFSKMATRLRPQEASVIGGLFDTNFYIFIEFVRRANRPFILFTKCDWSFWIGPIYQKIEIDNIEDWIKFELYDGAIESALEKIRNAEALRPTTREVHKLIVSKISQAFMAMPLDVTEI